MRPNDFDITLADAGVHTLINSISAPLVALLDADALEALIGYLTVYLAQPGSLAVVANAEALQRFVLHAQRAGQIDAEFLDASFSTAVKASVPQSPPVAPDALYLSDAGSGVVNASSSLGQNADRYELQHLDGGTWETVATGTPREDGADYQHTPGAGIHEYRVVARWGFFPSFPGESEEVTVA